MNQDLTRGPVVRSMLLFAIPMILGDLLQQCYNIADTLIVGQVLGRDALAAVGSSFTLMTFLTSILLGLCMGSGALVSMRFGQRDEQALRENLCASFLFIALVTAALTALAFACLDALRVFLRVPADVWGDMRAYLFVIFMGIPAVFLYNYFASFLRQRRTNEVVGRRMDFSSDANANFEGLLEVNREICMPQMAEKTSPDAPPNCAVVP